MLLQAQQRLKKSNHFFAVLCHDLFDDGQDVDSTRTRALHIYV